jgi:hypothetical protein
MAQAGVGGRTPEAVAGEITRRSQPVDLAHPYTVQYFERAVLEWHPANRPSFDILGSQLCPFALRAAIPTAHIAGAEACGGTEDEPRRAPGRPP